MKRWLLILGVVGCGAPEVPMAELDARLAEADCARLVRCGIYDDVARCLAFERQPGPVTPSITAAVAAGLVDYDPVEAAECVDQRAARSCSFVAEDVRIADTSVMCRGMFRSGRPLFDPCGIDAECASRSCPPDIDSCLRSVECCTGHCAAAEHHAGLGESCADNTCAPNLQCDTGFCLPLLPRGAPCILGNDCDWGLVCTGGMFGSTCQPPPKLGEPCPAPETGIECGVTLGLACDHASMTCQPRPREGAACAISVFGDPCAGGLRCDPDRGLCVRLPRVGEPCTLQGTCDAGAYCESSGEGGGELCLPLVDDGSPCNGRADACASGWCDVQSGLCSEPLACI